MPAKQKLAIFWFRRDLRLSDNAGLYHALRSHASVFPIFIFDTDILDRLDNKYDRRVDYIHQAVQAINRDLASYGATLKTFHGKPMQIFQELENRYEIDAVYCNRDYEPEAIKRDSEIFNFFKEKNILFKGYKDQVIFDKNDIVKSDATPYEVYTPYSNKWRQQLQPADYKAYQPDFARIHKQPFEEVIALNRLGFQKTDMAFRKPMLDSTIIDEYEKNRDYPALQKTTQLGVAFRFGTISIRESVAFGLKHNATWLSELIWREFFMQIMYHFPKVVHHSFKPEYDRITWRNNEKEFDKWCTGKTGYPFVDAGIRQLNNTGYMHNRVRMVVASFLCKHLLIDWRWGEAYFAQKLNDYDLSANNGNWQWAAGTGCDAAPYFRIFNPEMQEKKFDKDRTYVKRWIPELGSSGYPPPMVEHKAARERALKVYGSALKK